MYTMVLYPAMSTRIPYCAHRAACVIRLKTILVVDVCRPWLPCGRLRFWLQTSVMPRHGARKYNGMSICNNCLHARCDGGQISRGVL
jgi:hypothetical protein